MFNKIKWLLIKRQAKKEGYPIIYIPNRVIEKYRNDVRGNSEDSDLICILKLSRNFYSGQQIHKDNKYITIAYGCLHIHYDRINCCIYKCINYKEYSCEKIGLINEELKEKLNSLYGIKEDK